MDVSHALRVNGWQKINIFSDWCLPEIWSGYNQTIMIETDDQDQSKFSVPTRLNLDDNSAEGISGPERHISNNHPPL